MGNRKRIQNTEKTVCTLKAKSICRNTTTGI